MSTAAIHIEGLRCEAVDGRVTLDIAQLSLQPGERVAIVGPNGAGKSTLLRCLSGFAVPVVGRVQVLGRELCPRKANGELRELRREVAQVLQGLHLVQRLSALDNVLIGALGRLSGWRSWARVHHEADVVEALRALDTVGLPTQSQQRTDRLSGGERQRVAIARMLMQRPRLVLADEPTASLDPASAREVCALLRGSAAQATLITVVHHIDLLPLLADRVIGLRDGRVAFDQPLAKLDMSMFDALYGTRNHAPSPLQRHSREGGNPRCAAMLDSRLRGNECAHDGAYQRGESPRGGRPTAPKSKVTASPRGGVGSNRRRTDGP